MHAAVVTLSEYYNAVLADRLTRTLGLGWQTRQRGRNRNPAWEIQGVDEALIGEFSSRSHDIDAEKDRLVATHIAQHGRRPSAKTIIRLRQQATLATRPAKQVKSLAELTAGWRERATTLLGQDATAWARRVVAESDAIVIRADDVPLNMVDALACSVVATVGEKRSTWRRWNLHAEASRQTMGWRFATTADRDRLTRAICDAAEAQSLRLTPDAMSAPDEFQRPDGTSRFRPRHAVVYSSQNLFDAESRLIKLAETFTAPVVDTATMDRLLGQPDAQGRTLGADQAEALARVATSDRIAALTQRRCPGRAHRRLLGTDPLAEQLLADLDLLGADRDRAARVDHQMRGLTLVLRRELPTLLDRALHDTRPPPKLPALFGSCVRISGATT